MPVCVCVHARIPHTHGTSTLVDIFISLSTCMCIFHRLQRCLWGIQCFDSALTLYTPGATGIGQAAKEMFQAWRLMASSPKALGHGLATSLGPNWLKPAYGAFNPYPKISSPTETHPQRWRSPIPSTCQASQNPWQVSIRTSNRVLRVRNLEHPPKTPPKPDSCPAYSPRVSVRTPFFRNSSSRNPQSTPKAPKPKTP